jgi:hypothetical protein
MTINRVFARAMVAFMILTGSMLLHAQGASVTWKQSIEKSKYSPGPQPKNSQIRTIEPYGDGQIYKVEGVAGNGNKTSWGYSAHYDGMESPITGSGAPFGADSVTIKRIDASTTQETLKNAGKTVETTVSVISDGGKVLTITATGTNASGQPFTNILVFDKQ